MTLQAPADSTLDVAVGLCCGRDLQALSREAAFYQLPQLLHNINAHHITPQPGTREFYDSLYIETGFKSMKRNINEFEASKVTAASG